MKLLLLLLTLAAVAHAQVTENDESVTTDIIMNYGDPPAPPPPNHIHFEPKTTIPGNRETVGVNDKGEKLFEGDMLLDADQVEALGSPLDTRKAIGDEKRRWTNARVPYRLDRSSVQDRAAILKGLQHWMDNTCLKFVEVADGAQEPHLIFKKLNGCYSSVGMTYYDNGQDISIGQNCEGMGTVAHEVGHAIGFYHEQSRPDRNQYVKLIDKNLNKTMAYNFNIQNDINNYGVPYDLSSLMHYGLDYFTVNGKNTMVPLDVHKNFLIGQREKLSFYDVKLANTIYKCNAKCAAKPACRNDGYVDQNCRCRCPDGFTGTMCETQLNVPGPTCGGDFRSPTSIKSPNFPNNYPKGSKCIWLFDAPQGKRVQVAFREFDLLYREQTKNACLWDNLEVRAADIYEGERYCGTELANKQITSPGNKMALLFSGQYDYNKGFQATVTFV